MRGVHGHEPLPLPQASIMYTHKFPPFRQFYAKRTAGAWFQTDLPYTRKPTSSLSCELPSHQCFVLSTMQTCSQSATKTRQLKYRLHMTSRRSIDTHMLLRFPHVIHHQIATINLTCDQQAILVTVIGLGTAFHLPRIAFANFLCTYTITSSPPLRCIFCATAASL